MYHCKTEIQF